MNSIIKCFKLLANMIFLFIIILFIIDYLKLTHNTNTINYMNNANITERISNLNESIIDIIPFKLNSSELLYNNIPSISSVNDINAPSTVEKPIETTESDNFRKEILRRAKSMVDVEWTPSCNLSNKYSRYVFVKGKTYHGIPYSMDSYQAPSAENFLSKIKGSKILYGNDCSGFVSAAWGISRQTTLTLYEAIKYGKKVDNKTVVTIPWDNLKAGDALLLDNGKGKGHIMLFTDVDSNNKDKINVYEQNIVTSSPFGSIPVARKEVHSISNLKKEGYIPIRIL